MPPLFPAPRLPFQAKLKVGAVDDPLEHEADRIADQVMRMPELEGELPQEDPVSISYYPAERQRRCLTGPPDEVGLR